MIGLPSVLMFEEKQKNRFSFSVNNIAYLLFFIFLGLLIALKVINKSTNKKTPTIYSLKRLLMLFAMWTTDFLLNEYYDSKLNIRPSKARDVISFISRHLIITLLLIHTLYKLYKIFNKKKINAKYAIFDLSLFAITVHSIILEYFRNERLIKTSTVLVQCISVSAVICLISSIFKFYRYFVNIVFSFEICWHGWP